MNSPAICTIVQQCVMKDAHYSKASAN